MNSIIKICIILIDYILSPSTSKNYSVDNCVDDYINTTSDLDIDDLFTLKRQTGLAQITMENTLKFARNLLKYDGSIYYSSKYQNLFNNFMADLGYQLLKIDRNYMYNSIENLHNYIKKIKEFDKKFEISINQNKSLFFYESVETYFVQRLCLYLIFGEIENNDLYDNINIAHLFVDNLIDKTHIKGIPEIVQNIISNNQVLYQSKNEIIISEIINNIFRSGINNNTYFLQNFKILNIVNNKLAHHIQSDLKSNYKEILKISTLKTYYALKIYVHTKEDIDYPNYDKKHVIFNIRMSLILQLLDDLYDLKQDLIDNNNTVFTNIVKKGEELDNEVFKFYNFILDTKKYFVHHIKKTGLKNMENLVQTYLILMSCLVVYSLYYNKEYISNNLQNNIENKFIINLEYCDIQNIKKDFANLFFTDISESVKF